MSYTILRFEKRTGGTIRALESHHERKKESYNSNPDIDTEKSSLNYHIKKPTATYYQEIERRISRNNCKVRSNSIKFIDVLITSDNDFFKRYPEKDYFNRAYDFMCEKIGKDNIISAVVHNDEKTPHMHLCFTPITADRRLSAKEILGNKKKMSEWQDSFYSYMAERFDGLERGKSASETKRQHVPVGLYKQATALSQELEEIEKALSNINMINASVKRDNAIELLKDFFPKASTFIEEIEILKGGIEDFKIIESTLLDEIDRLKNENVQQLNKYCEQQSNTIIELDRLRKIHKEYNSFIASIPDDIYEQLKANYLNEAEQPVLFEDEL